MSYKIKNITHYKKELKTEKMNVPAILHVSDELMPNEATLQEIEETASSGFLFHHFAALSDVHSKKGRKNPAGTVIATEKYLLPQINDTAPNCGMRFIKTNLTDADLANGNLDKLFTELIRVIPTKKFIGTKIPYQLAIDICRFGSEAVKKYFSIRTKNEIENTYKNGNFFTDNIPSKIDILNVIPKLFFKIGRFRLGILGAAGNHFLDLMKISEIRDSEVAAKFGIHKGQYIFLMHTGSGLLGQYASYFYTPKQKEHLSQRIVLEIGKLFFNSQLKKVYQKISKKITEYKDKPEFLAYNEISPEGEMFIRAHWAAANHGFANRTILTHHLDQAIEKTLGKDPELNLLYDMPHVFVDKENHFGRDVWVHRNNASRAYGPSRIQHPIFSETGEPVFIPSSMSTSAYLAVGTDDNNSTFFSAAHGTGRRKNSQQDAAKNKEELLKKMQQSNIPLYNAKSEGVILQDRAYYKDVEEVVAGMVDNKIIKVVAKMEPVAVLMY